MSTNVVNLDALIPRDDFAVDDGPQRSTSVDRISIAHLDAHYFASDLRKPDFQRETVQWTPAKVVDLIRSFLDADLIPAVILWRAGRSIFVIDGAHRLSALLAWIKDDYGDRKTSLDFCGGYISDDQRRVAERTRDLVQKSVGTYAQYQAYKNNRNAAPADIQQRLSNLADNSIIAQWVPTTDTKSAENSFFKINQSATPIDPTERRILRARDSASAIASRAITHAGAGHSYWRKFDASKTVAIEALGKETYAALYDPPIGETPLKTLDVPIAGRGYNALPFVFDLVNLANDVKVQDTTAKKDIRDQLPPDPDGDATLSYLKAVKRRVQRLTGDHAMSLGVHPVVYFYTRSGMFQPTALLATSQLLEWMVARHKLVDFIKIRRSFEAFLIEHKEAMSLILHKFGSGERSLPWLTLYYQTVVCGLWEGKGGDRIQSDFSADGDFAFLTLPRPTGTRPGSTKSKQAFSTGTKTATFIATALASGTRCYLCGAHVHRNSIQFDHAVDLKTGGTSDMRNARVAHPYCNSVKDHLTDLNLAVETGAVVAASET